MKTSRNGNRVLVAAALMGALGMTALSAPSFAAESPFSQGTAKVRLSAAEKASLLLYANNSRSKIETALQEGAGKGFAEARGIYLKAIKTVILTSYEERPRSELLMRYALNQALELVAGIPSADGKATMGEGVLQAVSNQDLLTVILEDSMKLALSFYQEDRQAIESGSLLDLPYMKLAQERLALSRSWMASVTDPVMMYLLSVTSLQHFLNTAANSDQQRRAYYAEELTQVDELLQEYRMDPLPASRDLMRAVRVLRGKLRALQASLEQKARNAPRVKRTAPDRAAAAAKNQPGRATVSVTDPDFQACYKYYEPGMNSAEASDECFAKMKTTGIRFATDQSFKACYQIYYQSWNGPRAANQCVEYALHTGIDFAADANFLACYNLFNQDRDFARAADRCVDVVASTSIDFESPEFEDCFKLYHKSKFALDAGDRCVKQLK